MAVPMPQVEGVEHRWVDVNGFRMHYAEAGAGEPVILQHGWPQHWYAWRHQIAPLATRYRVIVPDLRGYGWSEAPRSGYDKAQFARDVVGLLDALGIERALYAGHDWGAVAAYVLGIDHADRFERLVALGAPPPWRSKPPPPQVIAAMLSYQSVIATPVVGGLAIRNGLPERLLKLAREIGEFGEDELRVYREPLSEPGHDNASVQTYRTFLLKDLPASFRGGAGRLTVPTLVLVGGAELLRKLVDPDGYDRFADDLRVEVVEGAGHWLPEETPDAVTEHLLAFFAAGRPAAAA